ncbi:MAG: hypothetical protein H6742_14065 [Alphaproteobacteria bacterium]|nr:hypothetical protein [Alphaproteobacteria bacterium]
MTRPLGLLAAAALLVGCGDKDDDDSGAAATDSGTSDTDSSATDTDTDADTDTDGTVERLGVVEHEGSAVVADGDYSGTETVSFIGDDGDGDVLCSYQLTLVDSAPRSDCDNCEWAFDLEITAASVVAETGPGCSETVGMNADGIAGLVGTTISYGYDPEFFSHAAVIMGFLDGEWKQLDYALFDEETDTFTYDWHSESLSY